MLGDGKDGDDEYLDANEIKKVTNNDKIAKRLHNINRIDGPYKSSLVSFKDQLDDLKEQFTKYPVADGKCEKIVMQGNF